jgi:hypothetical protein
VHGQELDAAQLQALARRMGRRARQRNTLYGALDGAARPLVARQSQTTALDHSAALDQSAALHHGAALDA